VQVEVEVRRGKAALRRGLVQRREETQTAQARQWRMEVEETSKRAHPDPAPQPRPRPPGHNEPHDEPHDEPLEPRARLQLQLKCTFDGQLGTTKSTRIARAKVAMMLHRYEG
jgi:hypothetical protein